MSVTPPVSHVEMCPYVASAAAESSNHAVTALRMLVSLMTYWRRRAPAALKAAA